MLKICMFRQEDQLSMILLNGRKSMKDLLSTRVKHYTIPVFIPELACPFQCIFCNQKKITDRLAIPEENEVTEIIERNLSTINTKASNVEVGFFGGNFTGIDASEQEKLLAIASRYLNKGLINGIRVSTRPDYIDEERVALLKTYGVSMIELGAQSMSDGVLRASGRGHKSADTVNSSRIINNAGIGLGLQMMIGLPEDTLEKSLFTAQRIVELGASCTRIYPALVIRDTKMEEMYLDGRYKPLELPEAVSWTKEIYKIFENSGVQIIRTGLHPSEGLLNGSAFLAGPFHISFRELVLSEIWKEIIQEKIIETFKDRISSDTCLKVYVPSDQINYAVGYKGINKKMLQVIFRNAAITADEKLKGREIYVDHS